MRIMVIGKNGQLGTDCVRALAEQHAVSLAGLPELDITDRETTLRAVRAATPDVLINAAAYTKVDHCEQEQALAHAINVDGAVHLAEAAAACKARFIHISTDYVFDGHGDPQQGYRETDAVNPVSVYGKTKAESERRVQQVYDNCQILRTAWLYGQTGRNFLKAVLCRATARPESPLRVVNDQIGSPTWSYRLAQQIEVVMVRGGTGIYHATAEGFGTWYECAKLFLACLGVDRRPEPCSTTDFPSAAPRPPCSVLRNERLHQEGLNLFPDWKQDVRSFAAHHGEQLMQEIQETTCASTTSS